jgi:hypothetical protein
VTEESGVTKIEILRHSFVQNWTTADIPTQTGTQAVVTGGSCGLGFETALALARAGADVILACGDGVAAREALDAIRQHAPGVLARFEKVDLACNRCVILLRGWWRRITP